MRASIVIAAHNEGHRLWRTVQSCLESAADLPCEVVVVDDASTDGSVAEAHRRFPQIRTIRESERTGCSAAKDLGARRSRGDVILFLDGHCKPEHAAVRRLVDDVEELDGEAIVTPRVTALDCRQWKSLMFYAGHGYRLDLQTLEGKWVRLDALRPRGRFFESPGFVGCCLALSRKLYRKLGGFDRDMREWGVEDIDLSLKAWLMGHPVLHDPRAIIGHRFRRKFDNFRVSVESVLANQLRTARKNFSEPVWEDWLSRFRSRQPSAQWEKAWELFQEGQPSAERERRYLHENRKRDEFWFARRFSLPWPRKRALPSESRRAIQA